MKNRVRKIANFFAFNLLFFALYLNFVQKDKINIRPSQQSDAFSETVYQENSDQEIENKNETTVASQHTVVDKSSGSNTVALKLSIN